MSSTVSRKRSRSSTPLGGDAKRMCIQADPDAPTPPRRAVPRAPRKLGSYSEQYERARIMRIEDSTDIDMNYQPTGPMDLSILDHTMDDMSNAFANTSV